MKIGGFFLEKFRFGEFRQLKEHVFFLSEHQNVNEWRLVYH